MEKEEENSKECYSNPKLTDNEANTDLTVSHSEQNFVNLVAEIIVNISMKEYHDRKKGN